MFEYFLTLLAGSLYGFVFGLIPVAGATTALITIYSFIDWFRADPYLMVIFTTAVVVSSSIGDSFASVLMNIPGAGGSAATMVDGFPLARKGQAARALSAAITTSAVNGILWGAAVFLFLPLYAQAILYVGIPEILAFLLFALCAVVFINGKYWIRGIIAVLLGIFLGLIGQDPITGAERWTGGWQYLGDGIQLAPILAGVIAFPELIEAYRNKSSFSKMQVHDADNQIRQGAIDSLKYKKDGIRGGIVGAIVGIIPGIGGNVADWLAYGQTLAANQKEKVPFGEGNIKGVIGCEGANNAQKATSYVPTVLFGIPGAPFEVIIISLFMLVGLELGSPTLLENHEFFNVLALSYGASILLAFFGAIWFIKRAVLITKVSFSVYFWPVLALLLWASVQYTGGWEDYVFFAICCISGLFFKYFKINRAALIIGFALADRIEGTGLQYLTVYNWWDIGARPISSAILICSVCAIIYGVFFNKTRIGYV